MWSPNGYQKSGVMHLISGLIHDVVGTVRWGRSCRGSGASIRIALLASLFVELMESLRQAEQKNWSLDQHHIANLCDSLNHFLTQTGHMPSQGGSHRPPAPPRITDSCALTSGKQEPALTQGTNKASGQGGGDCDEKGLGREGQKGIEENHLMGSDPT